ncbi:Galactosylgalactosylxylosylprotein 3-beta-glucuronosyltransferase [Paragonimus heterotremus]|uniref:Galactosylgalactosylxylosylprotein 3-beta-glucuronosyltransferase n=1 Tax=Paragonimus heterotremus TaxID=100268 RepID=A0A8J4T3W9_9TREM|nr:Galactosylgalactosylxylosylprotein 3-beta-glucuronosyltransferase [Paragonimus heterotremus]
MDVSVFLAYAFKTNAVSMRFSKRSKRCLTLVIALFVGLLYVFRTHRKSISETYSGVYSNTKIYILTATYPRLVQRAELTRLCNTLRNVRNIHWIVCEDSESKTNLTATLLARCGVPYTHLFAETPPFARQTPSMPYWTHPRGVAQRNRGLQWLREVLVQGHDKAVLYIADDDNTYSLDLFEEYISEIFW